MLARVIFEGQLSETLRDVIPELLSKANIMETYFYVNWNGSIFIVSPEDTEDSLLEKFEDGMLAQSLLHEHKRKKRETA